MAIHEIGEVPITSQAITTGTVTKIMEFNGARKYLYLGNEDASNVVYFAFGGKDTAITDFAGDGTDMQRLKADTDLHFSDGAISNGTVFIYHAKGSNLTLKHGQYPNV
jgi:hypothetical protein